MRYEDCRRHEVTENMIPRRSNSENKAYKKGGNSLSLSPDFARQTSERRFLKRLNS